MFNSYNNCTIEKSRFYERNKGINPCPFYADKDLKKTVVIPTWYSVNIGLQQITSLVRLNKYLYFRYACMVNIVSIDILQKICVPRYACMVNICIYRYVTVNICN